MKVKTRWSWLLLLGLLGTVALARADSHPLRGSSKWVVLLCATADAGTPTRTPAFFQGMFVTRYTGGLADYMNAVSYGAVNYNGTLVRGWYRMASTTAQYQTKGRWDKVNECRNTAAASTTNPTTVPAGYNIAVITFPSVDLFGWTGGAFLPHDVDLGSMGHETSHGLSLAHSFSDDPTYQNAPWAAIGEYDDPWDVMSWGNNYGRPTTRYGFGPTGMNAYHVDRMGWIGRSRVVTFGADGTSARTLNIAALNRPIASGPLLVRVPFNPGDLNNYYTVEFRRKIGNDIGIPADIVLIHEVKKVSDGTYRSYLLRDRTTRNPVQFVNANGVTIAVNSVNTTTNQAMLTITSQIVSRCLQGYVWREARPGDLVCVVGSTRTETRQENALATSRRSPTGGAYGPDTCLVGYVWREAYPNDHVCVPGYSRSRAWADNAAAASRGNPARLVYGPNTCRAGYVWREADDKDYVCVVGSTRTETRQENTLAASRRSPTGGAYGPDTCLLGYVWREAYPNDHVCVPGYSRSRAWADNAAAWGRVTYN